jgi:hypothetical protein
MKNVEKYINEICCTIANANECYFSGDCLTCEINGICCDSDKLLKFMLQPVDATAHKQNAEIKCEFEAEKQAKNSEKYS